MRAAGLLLPTLRDAPADAVAASHRLLVRAGYARQLGAGLWTILPLGVRSLQRITGIIRQEMDAIGGQELLMPILQPAEIWKRTGRYSGEQIFKLRDRAGRDLVLAMTHEEIIATHAAAEIRSYRDLPQIWYQFQTKERDEPRPQGGLLRTREFVMKDAYTLDRDRDGLEESYARHGVAYERIFDRVGLEWYRVESDVGMMGGYGAEEFMAPSPVGEDRIALCERGDYAGNVEVATSVATHPEFPPSQAPEEVETPGAATIEALAAYLGVDARTTMKAVLVVPEDERGGIVLALVRGDHRVHDLKLSKVLDARFRPAQPDEIRAAFGADPGSIGAVGVRPGALREVIADSVLEHGAYVAGANRTGWHLRGVELGRDFQARVADIRFVEDGDGCPICGGALHIEPAIEVGNIFKLGTKYAEDLGARYLDESGREQPIWMGSYGIGPSRTLAAVAEQHHDERGLALPQSVAPYDVWVTAIGPEALPEADRLDAELGRQGLQVLVDDRALSPGVRFADADLIGVPIRVTIGKKLTTEGTIGIKTRAGGGEESVAPGDAVERILALADTRSPA